MGGGLDDISAEHPIAPKRNPVTHSLEVIQKGR